MTPHSLADHFFRHEYGRLVAILSRRWGVVHLEAIEDAIQGALVKALEAWKGGPVPQDPSAWLYRVASNRLIGDLRQRNRRRAILERHAPAFPGSTPASEPGTEFFSEREITDDVLNLMAFCCDPNLAPESQLVLALKTLCGFDVREIALRLFLTEDNVYKRLARARAHLRSRRARGGGRLDAARVAGVLRVLYSLFAEGYLSTRLEGALRNDLCDEALRLARLLAGHPVGDTPETSALVALMLLHRARSSSRMGAGGLVLLEDQDRALWSRDLIHQGLGWLERSARGDRYSRYHAEAAIAAEHCLAPSFSQTNWETIVHQYDLLIALEPSALHELNRAVAVAEARGPAAALALLEHTLPPNWLALSFGWSAVLADLHRRNGNRYLAHRYYTRALVSAPSPEVARLLERRFTSMPPSPILEGL